MHKCILPSFFFTKRTGVPHGDILGLTNLFSNNSSNCSFNFSSSATDIRYGAIEIGLVP
ncbi:hypothetical protein A2U01_0088218, partial [Trifolium medium]|nr:hypothetical protein [Trifolium medium]